jgi:type II secretory ATPase GspE/PulE/Tfp pilus assembly ATPase PilB-like protein
MASKSDDQTGAGPSAGGEPGALERLDVTAHVTAVAAVEHMLQMAVRLGASDVHCEPGPEGLGVRFRIDGRLTAVGTLPPALRDGVITRLKVLARLDVAERRLPQDGRFTLRADGSRDAECDIRASTMPTMLGEKAVLRVVARTSGGLDFEALGFDTASAATFRQHLQRPWGLVLVTGPTGSGKTSTLYAALQLLATPDRHIITVEDPVERALPGVTQVAVRDSIGLGFAAVLRASLRQDPDIMLVGEIRDAETAAVAMQAALTGHLVLATLHTTDAPGAPARLLDMGVPPFLVAGALSMVCAQRLVRRRCRQCQPLAEAHCAACRRTGYRGRTGLFEVMTMTDALRALVMQRASAQQLRSQALSEGMVSLRHAGLQRVIEGVTSLEEVWRETADDGAGPHG